MYALLPGERELLFCSTNSLVYRCFVFFNRKCIEYNQFTNKLGKSTNRFCYSKTLVSTTAEETRLLVAVGLRPAIQEKQRENQMM